MSSGSSTDYLLAVEDLTVSFDGFKAVDSLTFYVDADELHVIIGPNGAGKTTVLDLISGKTAASEGSIKFNNQELLGKREHAIVRAGVGRKFQTPSIYEDLTVLENLEISFPWGRTVWGSLTFNRTPEISDKIHKVAEEIYLSDKLDEKAELLSHGQKQWLEIGMLLVQEPELMLLDEPVAGMSVKEREATAKLLKKVAKGRSIIIIEHDMEFVESIANRVTVLHMGKILAEGNMAEIKANETVKHVYLGD
ncbi:urea ABC transporter ATP-binding protein UrtD [Verrucomicrobiales bacterium]|nr:urea ABC transporter ATP-binding protein UrtD [Verrucomicrobiales bacterium]MDA7614785.1 urea ABC transporter ATP-binding protein UrtD [Verrucomicrobiales bacterium]